VSGPSQLPAQSDVWDIICMTPSYPISMSTTITVGVLALQGAYFEHFKLLAKAATEIVLSQNLNWQFLEVRTSHELAQCDALIIPGGESTTVSLVAARSNLLEPLRDFVKYVTTPS